MKAWIAAFSLFLFVTHVDNDIFLKGSSMVTFSLWHSMSHLRFVEGICQCDRTHKTHMLLQEAGKGESIKAVMTGVCFS